MSHSTVLIVVEGTAIGERLSGGMNFSDALDEAVADQLAPFDENTQVPRYKVYVDPAPEGWEVGVANTQKFKELKDSGVEHKEAWGQVWGEKNSDPHLDWPRGLAHDEEGIDPADDAAVAAFYNARYPEEGDEYYVDSDGLYSWSTYNPKSRWDWYSIGGRWAGLFILKPGVEVLKPGYVYRGMGATPEDVPPPDRHVDVAYKRDIDFEAMAAHDDETHHKSFREYDPDDAKTHVSWMDPSMNPQPDETEEQFVERSRHPFVCYAFLKDGEWAERGKMGWWGISMNEDDNWDEMFQVLLAEVREDDLLCVVDVHI